MNKKLFCALVLFYLITNVCLAIELEHSTKVKAQWGINTRDGSSQSLNLILQPELVFNFDNGIRLTSIARIHSDLISNIAPGSLNRQAYNPVNKPLLASHELELELREFYLEAEWKQTYFTLGKQQTVWGKADGLKVLDVVNPQTFREFILADFDDSRIPQWTLKLEHTIGPVDLEFIWLPDQTYHALPEQNSTYGFTSLRLVPSQPPAGVNLDLRKLERPNRFIQDSDVGLRLTSFWEGWDLTLNYLYQYDNLPVLFQQFAMSANGPTVTVTPQYKRTHVFGTTFSNAFDDWVIRGEIAWFSNRHFLTRSPLVNNGVIASPELFYVIGLDWSAPYDIVVSTQLFQSWIIKSSTNLTRDKHDTTLSMMLSRQFLNDTLDIQLLVLGNVNDGDGMIRPKINYQLNDDVKVWLGADFFYGDSKGVFGQFKKNDRVLVGAEWVF